MTLDLEEIRAARPETIAGLAKGLAIIELFASHGQLTVSEAARGSGTTPAAARRCLLTLADLGYLRQAGRHFEPTMRLRWLGGFQGPTLAEIADPVIARARDEMNETLCVAVLEGNRAKFVVRAEAGRMIQTGVRAGVSLPAWSTAAGRVLLGNYSDEWVQRYLAKSVIEARTPRSITDRTALAEAVREARQTGIACNDEELELGVRAFAVAVRSQGAIIAAITFSALAFQISLEEMVSRYQPSLEATAEKLAKAWQEACR